MIFRGRILIVAVALWIGWMPQGASAHHSYAVYDSEHPITLTGVMRAVTFEHPHVEAQLDVQGRVWTLDLPSPSRAIGRGLTEEFLAVGKAAIVMGWPHRAGSAQLAPVQITIDGQTVQIRGSRR